MYMYLCVHRYVRICTKILHELCVCIQAEPCVNKAVQLLNELAQSLSSQSEQEIGRGREGEDGGEGEIGRGREEEEGGEGEMGRGREGDRKSAREVSTASSSQFGHRERKSAQVLRNVKMLSDDLESMPLCVEGTCMYMYIGRVPCTCTCTLYVRTCTYVAVIVFPYSCTTFVE